MTLVVRDEVDVIDAQLAFHLNAGVDLVLVTDHLSADGTTEILEGYARDGHVRLFREGERWNRQGRWMTRMARLAATEHGVDWVLLSDGDEFWWPRGGSLKEVLGAIPPRFGVIHAPSRTFLPRPADGRSFAERMNIRLAVHAPINDPATPFRPVAKIAVRAHERLVVRSGNHTISGVPFEHLRSWHPIELLHLPLRSPEQCARKYEKTLTAWEANLRGDLARARQLSEQSQLESFYARIVVDDGALQAGLAAGLLARDTRLRDALRTLAGEREVPATGARFRSPSRSSVLPFPTPTVADEASYAVDVAVLREAESIRARRRLDQLEPRLESLERRPWKRLGRRARPTSGATFSRS
jgi:hypothetical protein